MRLQLFRLERASGTQQNHACPEVREGDHWKAARHELVEILSGKIESSEVDHQQNDRKLLLRSFGRSQQRIRIGKAIGRCWRIRPLILSPCHRRTDNSQPGKDEQQ